MGRVWVEPAISDATPRQIHALTQTLYARKFGFVSIWYTYSNATDEQFDVAWELFLYHMERQGNATKMKREGELAPKED